MAENDNPETQQPTADEQEILDWYRRLSERDQKNLLKQARSNDTPTNKAFRGSAPGWGK